MKLEDFSDSAKLIDKSEIQRAELITYFIYKSENLSEINIDNILSSFEVLNYAYPNKSRLTSKINKSNSFVKGRNAKCFRLSPRKFAELDKEFSSVLDEFEVEISCSGDLLPKTLYKGTRGYIENLCNQINSAYEHRLFDCCAAMMRRLMEVLLILAYREIGSENLIMDDSGHYRELQFIINHLKSNKVFQFDKGSYDILEKFRILGNFSVHKIEYSTKLDDIKPHVLFYRAAIEELFFKTGIRS